MQIQNTAIMYLIPTYNIMQKTKNKQFDYDDVLKQLGFHNNAIYRYLQSRFLRQTCRQYKRVARQTLSVQ